MEHNRVSRIGDFNFQAAKAEFMCLHDDFPLRKMLEKQNSVLAFQKTALDVANIVCRTNPHASAIELGHILELKMFNDVKQRAQNANFLSSRFDKKKASTPKYGESVSVLGS